MYSSTYTRIILIVTKLEQYYEDLSAEQNTHL